MAAPIHFTNELVLQLLESYRSHELLWDTSNSGYKDRVKKNEAWEDLALSMRMPRREVETKIHTLRSQFTRENKKIALMRRNGKENAKSSWFAFNAMKFLMKGEPLEYSDDLDIQTQHSNDQFSESFLAENFIAVDQYESTDTRDTPPPKPSNHKSRKRTISDDKSNDGDYSYGKHSRHPDDEFEVYARYVASELRHTRDQYSILMAKHHINDILFNARMGKYRRGSSFTGAHDVTAAEGCIKIERDA